MNEDKIDLIQKQFKDKMIKLKKERRDILESFRRRVDETKMNVVREYLKKIGGK